MSHLIEPHGGKLIDLMVTPERREELRELSREIPSWDLTPRQLCDLEILMTGGFSPLDGFMTRKDADSVASRMRLADGTLWPMPITLDVTEPLAARLQPGGLLALRDPEGVMLAVLHVEDLWPHDRKAEARGGLRHHDETHPGVAHLFQSHQQHRRRRAGRRPGAAVALRLPRAAPHAGRAAPRVRASWAGARSSRSRPATRCTARTSSSRTGARRASRPTC